ncbi:hypothetical protein G5B40_07915 [Pikeienuella piscinae]|uniref:Flagellin C-terminal domain-containing protein n=1 Tax=Pikeienuella piscinae TaxID=2748098 RepID=A0A7L5C0M0_9RHOB|nr:flagellin [Pikeienuella piscinae]QIE55389.1 hypothetical protein G5B40_07915 [Pikeienuella piscinae]
MYATGTPDLMSNLRSARLLAQVQTDFARASEEVTTGRKADVIEASGGDPIKLYALERELALNAERAISIDVAIGRIGATQTALERLQNATGTVGVRLAAAVSIGDVASAEQEAGAARGAFEEAVSALNTRFGDRMLFSGAATDGAALAPGDEILAQIAARVAPATDAAGAIAAVDDYFSDPAGFAATGYLGSLTDAAAAEVETGQRVDFALRADREEIVQALTALALGVIGVEGGYPGATNENRMIVMGEAAQRGLSAIDEVVSLRGEIGIAEARLETAKIRISSERTFLQESRNAVIAKDPFEAAVAFTSLETQLETILSVTARLSSLNLTNFL